MYKIIQSDPGNGLFEGQTVKPYYEDENEIIIQGTKADMQHHVKKNSRYFTDHFKPVGGNA